MKVPTEIAERFSKYADDLAATKEIGIEIATNIGAELLRRGVPGLHFYTMNSADSTLAIAKNLGLIS
jgi:methylenetetrahydrofolate reductase (NADPH)